MSDEYNEESCNMAMKFKEEARKSYKALDMSTGCGPSGSCLSGHTGHPDHKGFPDASSYIYGYMEASKAHDSKLQNVLRFLETLKNMTSPSSALGLLIDGAIEENK